MMMLTTVVACVLVHGSPPAIQWGGAHSGVMETRIELVTDADMLKAAWKLTHDGSIEDLPMVNFDRCRLLLACRGLEENVQRVTATQIDLTERETVVSIDADPIMVAGEESEDTTAWGLFMIPRTPEVVRVRYAASRDQEGEPVWETIIVLDQGAGRGPRNREGMPESARDRSPRMQQEFEAHLERMRRPFTVKLAEPPNYFVSHGYDERWTAALKAGIDASRAYLGNHGPLQVYVLGQEEDELADPVHRKAIADAFCAVHNRGSDRPLDECLSTDGEDMAQKAFDGRTEAYMTAAMDSDPPVAELVFINAHTMGGEELMPTRSIHEYAHVYQKSFEFMPTWMMEGGAELLAAHLGEKKGWGDRNQTLKWYAQHLDRAKDLKYTIRDMEEIETAPPDVARWHRELAYDAGAWAVVFAISKSSSRSIRRHFRSFYPMVDELGWQNALCKYTGMGDIDVFYDGFELFMDQSVAERLAILDTLED